MPFPLSKVRYLSDYQGAFALSVSCTVCQNERVIPAQSLAHRATNSARVSDVVKRLRCSRCNSRQVEAMVVGIPR
jgi:hypothetical protein